MNKAEVCGWLLLYLLGIILTALCITLTTYLYKAQIIINQLKDHELLSPVNFTCLIFFFILSTFMIVVLVAIGFFFAQAVVEGIYEDAVQRAKAELKGNVPIEEL